MEIHEKLKRFTVKWPPSSGPALHLAAGSTPQPHRYQVTNMTWYFSSGLTSPWSTNFITLAYGTEPSWYQERVLLQRSPESVLVLVES